MPVGRGKAAVDLFRSHGGEHAEKWLPMRAHTPFVVHHLIEVARKNAVIAREQRFEVGSLLRSAVEMGHPGHQI